VVEDRAVVADRAVDAVAVVAAVDADREAVVAPAFAFALIAAPPLTTFPAFPVQA
jgi:hypothetical protein